MLKPRVVCTRVHEIGKTELLDVPQTLELRENPAVRGKILHFDI
jgi:hypothetical protein